MSNAVAWNRLAKLGLRDAAEAYKEEIRLRLWRLEPKDSRHTPPDRRREIKEQAEAEMLKVFEPLAQRLESQQADQAPAPPPAVEGIPADISAALDPAYTEADPGKQLRDGLLWCAFQWMRILCDTDSGPVVHLERATAPPPNAFALFVLSTYALSDPDKRRELLSRALAFATKVHDTVAPQDADPQNEYLERL